MLLILLTSFWSSITCLSRSSTWAQAPTDVFTAAIRIWLKAQAPVRPQWLHVSSEAPFGWLHRFLWLERPHGTQKTWLSAVWILQWSSSWSYNYHWKPRWQWSPCISCLQTAAPCLYWRVHHTPFTFFDTVRKHVFASGCAQFKISQQSVLLTDGDRTVGVVLSLLVYYSDSNFQGTALTHLGASGWPAVRKGWLHPVSWHTTVSK